MQIVTPPIFIVSMPRSGSSMTAGIFHKHGAWVGTHRPGNNLNEKGFFENLKIKDLLIKHFGKPTVNLKDIKEAQYFDGLREEFENTVLKDGYPNDGTPWVAKFSAMYLPAVWEAFPEAKVICVRRDRKSVIDSAVNGTKMMKMEAVQPHIDVMERAKKYGAMNVYFDTVIEGDYSSFRYALENCGFEYDNNIVKNFVDPNLKHY